MRSLLFVALLLLPGRASAQWSAFDNHEALRGKQVIDIGTAQVRRAGRRERESGAVSRWQGFGAAASEGQPGIAEETSAAEMGIITNTDFAVADPRLDAARRAIPKVDCFDFRMDYAVSAFP